jgi:hypothetical protein
MANNEHFDMPGVVETIEADFNNETGNIAFRATFPNPNPPQFPLFSNTIAFPVATFNTPRAVFIKLIVNLRRNNATPETQNILYVQTFRLDELINPFTLIQQQVNIGCVPNPIGFLPPSCPLTPLSVPAMPVINDLSKIVENIVFRNGSTIAPQSTTAPITSRFAWGSLIVQPGEVTYTSPTNNQYYCLSGVFYEDGATPMPSGYTVYQYWQFPSFSTLPFTFQPSKFTPQATSAFIQSACATTYKNQSQRWSKAEKIGDVGVEELKAGVEKSEDFVAFPNPANSEVTIRYQIEQQGNVEISITDMLGRVVFEPIVSQNHETGIYEVKFNTSSLAEGVYFYHLKADGIHVTKKLMIVK